VPSTSGAARPTAASPLGFWKSGRAAPMIVGTLTAPEADVAGAVPAATDELGGTDELPPVVGPFVPGSTSARTPAITTAATMSPGTRQPTACERRETARAA